MHRFNFSRRWAVAGLLALTALVGIAYAQTTTHFKGPIAFDTTTTFTGTATFNGTTTFDGSDRSFTDNTKMILGTGSDYDFYFNATDLVLEPNTNNLLFNLGNGTESSDLKVFGSSTALYFSWDASANDLKLEDSVSLMFGTGAGAGMGNAGDVEIRWDASDIDVLAAADNTVWKWGATGNSFDMWWYGSDATHAIVFDCSDDDLTFDDSVSIMLGTGEDVEIRWDGTDLDILAAANNSVIKFGTGTNSFDVWIYGSSSSEYVLWDASRDAVVLTGNAKIIPTNGVEWFDDFQAEVWDTNEYTTNTDADPTLVVVIVEGAAGAGGYLSLAADDVDNDKQEFAGALSWNSSKVTVFECRIQIAADVTTTKLNIGLSDAKNEAANTIAFEIGAGDDVTETCTDGVCFVYDTEGDTDGWFGCIAGTTDESEGAGATPPVASTYQTLRFEIDSARKVSFYIDGALYGAQTTAAIDAAKSLGFYLATESTTTAARTVNLDYVYIWQDR